MFPRVKQKLFFLVYVGKKCWTTRMSWTWVSMGQVHVKSIYHSPSSIVIKVLKKKNKTENYCPCICNIVGIYFGDFSWSNEKFRICFLFASLLQCMAFSQLLMKLCPTVDTILPKGIGGISKITKSKVGKTPRTPLRTLFWYFENEAVFYRKRAVDF